MLKPGDLRMTCYKITLRDTPFISTIFGAKLFFFWCNFTNEFIVWDWKKIINIIPFYSNDFKLWKATVAEIIYFGVISWLIASLVYLAQ